MKSKLTSIASMILISQLAYSSNNKIDMKYITQNLSNNTQTHGNEINNLLTNAISDQSIALQNIEAIQIKTKMLALCNFKHGIVGCGN